jgi:hypothetical protein
MTCSDCFASIKTIKDRIPPSTEYDGKLHDELITNGLIEDVDVLKLVLQWVKSNQRKMTIQKDFEYLIKYTNFRTLPLEEFNSKKTKFLQTKSKNDIQYRCLRFNSTYVAEVERLMTCPFVEYKEQQTRFKGISSTIFVKLPIFYVPKRYEDEKTVRTNSIKQQVKAEDGDGAFKALLSALGVPGCINADGSITSGNSGYNEVDGDSMGNATTNAGSFGRCPLEPEIPPPTESYHTPSP